MFRELEVFDVHNWVLFSLRTGDQRCSFDVIVTRCGTSILSICHISISKNTIKTSSGIIIPLSAVCPVF